MKARLLPILLVFFFSGAAMAANTDSLEAVLKNRNGSEKIATLHLLAKEYSRPDPAKSLKYIQQALQIINDTNSPVYADLCYLAAYNYRSLKQYDSIVVYYQKALKTYQNTGDTLNIMKTSTMYALEYQRRGDFKRASDIQNIGLQLFEPFWKTHSEDGNISQSHYATMLSNMSINMENLGYLDSALKYITKTYTIHQNMNASPRKIGYTLVNIGIVYLNMNRNDDAIRYFYDAKEKFTEINDTFNLAKCYNNIGLANKQKGDTVNAIKFYNISLSLNRKINNPEGVVSGLVNLSGLYDNKKYFNKVENFLLEAIKKSKELKMEYYLSVSLQNLATLYFEAGKYDLSLKYANQTRELIKKTGVNKSQQLNYHLLSKIYEKKGDYKKALEFHKLFKQATDQVFNEDNSDKFNKLQVEFETELKEQKIELLQKEKEKEQLEKQVLSRQKQLYGMGITMLLIIILVGSFIIFLKRQKDKQIQKQKELIHIREKELAGIELEKRKLIENELNIQLEYKSKQLTSHALNMMKKNRFLQEVEQNITSISKKPADTIKGELRHLNTSIKRMNKSDKDWELFKNYFEEVNRGFYERLAEKFNGLSSNDYKLLALIKLNMNIKETASVLNISPDSVKTARYRLRKKLSLKQEDDLYKFVAGV
jgi:tetratricopeptide (TPR) repeat protein